MAKFGAVTADLAITKAVVDPTTPKYVGQDVNYSIAALIMGLVMLPVLR